MSLLCRETVKECSSSVTVIIRLVWIVASIQADYSIYRKKVYCPGGFILGPPGFCYKIIQSRGEFQQSLQRCKSLHANASLALAYVSAQHRKYCSMARYYASSDFVWLGAVQRDTSDYDKNNYRSIRTNKNFQRYYYTRWGDDEPNYDSQLCIGIQRSGGCDHFDLECDRELSGVCEVIYTDPCEQKNHGCKQLCISRGVNDTYCDCRAGFRKEGQKNCEDIDECATDNGGCTFRCNNAIGGFNCFQNCSEGFQINEESGECEDINECKNVNGFCHHKCINKKNGEGFYCDCLKGFVLMTDGTCATANDTNTNQITMDESTFYWISGVFVVLGMIGSAGIAFKTVKDVNAIEKQLIINKDNNDDKKSQETKSKSETLEENNDTGTGTDSDERKRRNEDDECGESNVDGFSDIASVLKSRRSDDDIRQSYV